MLSVTEAVTRIIAQVRPLPVEHRPLSDCVNAILAAAIESPQDSPPFDKALMDGYAIRSKDLTGESAIFSVIETITAGEVPTMPLASGQATRIMTGSPLPDGSDAVVPFEMSSEPAETGNIDGERIQLSQGPYRPGANMMRRGESVTAGAALLSVGRSLRAIELGAAAEMGFDQLPVRRTPRVAILSTGDELVPIGQPLEQGQIRNSNETMLIASCLGADAIPVPLGIARDNRDELREKIEEGLRSDVLLLTGGVSAGTRDLVPECLAATGVQDVFHGVKIKPGKPLFFGYRDSETEWGRRTLVFGLPGNPVSSLVGFAVFVRTALRGLTGRHPVPPVYRSARLGANYLAKGNRPTYHPARTVETPGGLRVDPLPWKGSADLCGTVGADVLIHFPQGTTEFTAGERIDVLDLNHH